MRTPFDQFSPRRFYGWGPPEKPEKGDGEDLETKVNMLLQVFAPQVEEIREHVYQERLAQYKKELAEYNATIAEAKEAEKRREEEAAERSANRRAFVDEYMALDSVGDSAEYAARRLADKFSTVEQVRAASDNTILCIDGIGWKTLDGIRQRTHDHSWETFETSSGNKGTYCDGCKARTGFVAC